MRGGVGPTPKGRSPNPGTLVNVWSGLGKVPRGEISSGLGIKNARILLAKNKIIFL